MRNLAIIPARSGSKGLINKNIRNFNGKPLIAYTIEEAIKSNVFTEVMVSTDSKEYADIGIEYGAKVPFLRPEEIAQDLSSSWEVVRDVVKKYALINQHFDTVILLQPTSPLRDAEDIKNSLKYYLEKEAKFVASVCVVDHSPLWSNVLPANFSLNQFINTRTSNSTRQDLRQYYRLNGAIYIINTDFLFETNDFYCNESYAFIMNKMNSIDIDDETDFFIAEAIMKHKKDLFSSKIKLFK